jgi:hypothetical protein
MLAGHDETKQVVAGHPADRSPSSATDLKICPGAETCSLRANHEGAKPTASRRNNRDTLGNSCAGTFINLFHGPFFNCKTHYHP